MILSGVFEGMTTGTPVALVIQNTDQRSKDYGDIACGNTVRRRLQYAMVRRIVIIAVALVWPAKQPCVLRLVIADLALKQALARPIVSEGQLCKSARTALTGISLILIRLIKTRFSAAMPRRFISWEAYLDEVRKGIHQQERFWKSWPAVFRPAPSAVIWQADAETASAMMSINAATAEIGSGFAPSALDGAVAGDEMRKGDDGTPVFLSNPHGGVLGGISSGQMLLCGWRSPTSSS